MALLVNSRRARVEGVTHAVERPERTVIEVRRLEVVGGIAVNAEVLDHGGLPPAGRAVGVKDARRGRTPHAKAGAPDALAKRNVGERLLARRRHDALLDRS